ncbi:MAG: LytTR family DNA-binding domain-containing protein [Lachnospiraceae bacterium]|nr:LytTR family DNA-binding domain-containing protein [Lachnospiraceae bacterium]
MKIKIELDGELQEEEIIIKCRELTEKVQEIQKAVANAVSRAQKFVLYKGDTEYYLPLKEILFFETDNTGICAHTRDSAYTSKYKLYELEELLPASFLRVSKSTILNMDQVYSIEKNLTASSLVEFQNSHKQVYVSRNYYKLLKDRLNARKGAEKANRKRSRI